MKTKRRLSPEQCFAISQRMKAAWQNKKYRKAMIGGQRSAKARKAQTPEHKAKIAAAMRLLWADTEYRNNHKRRGKAAK